LFRKPVSIIILSLLVVSALALAFNVQIVRASGTIYIRPDGSIDPPTAPIYTADNITYTLTGNITADTDGIAIERDNIILNGAGYTVQGTGSGTGITLSGRTNVTIQNTTIKAFGYGLDLGALGSSSNNSIVGNDITANNYDGIELLTSSSNSSSSSNRIVGNNINANSGYGLYLGSSSSNSVSGNNITNNGEGIGLYWYSNNNNMSGNDVTANNRNGIYLWSSSGNSIVGNNVTANRYYGLFLDSSSNNSIVGNNVTANNYDGVDLVSSSSGNSIVGNNVTANRYYGLYLVSSSSNSIVGNNVTANGYYGLDLVSSSSNSIDGNDITANSEVGLCLLSSSNYNSIVGNNVTANAIFGIYLYSSDNNRMRGNDVTANKYYGLYLGSSSNYNSIVGNNIAATSGDGLYLDSSSNNSILGNNIAANNYYGLSLGYSSNNSIVGNNVTANGVLGLNLISSSGNTVYHNNFMNNTRQAYSSGSTSVWDDGYPSGGNYWSDYTGLDQKCGPNQDHPGSDEMEDTPYVVDINNQDNYPLMNPWTPPAGHNIAIVSVVSSKIVIFQGFSGNITVYGANKGEYPETFNVTAYANTTSIASAALPLESGSITNITLPWNTTGFAKGNYTISAYAEPVPGETNTTNNNFTGEWVTVSMVGDLTGGTSNPWDFVPDGKVDGKDIAIVALCYGSAPGYPPPYVWNANCDVNGDSKVDGKDIAIVALHYGQAGP